MCDCECVQFCMCNASCLHVDELRCVCVCMCFGVMCVCVRSLCVCVGAVCASALVRVCVCVRLCLITYGIVRGLVSARDLCLLYLNTLCV